jgi:hypothetical protein
MRTGVLLCLACLAAWPAGAEADRADLARARNHYNQRQFDEAIAAATAARRSPETADSAAIVLARAHLERYRERADPTDLSAARTALGLVRTTSLGQRDQLELLLAFGESLFLEDDFGAAAEMFESGLDRARNTSPDLAESIGGRARSSARPTACRASGGWRRSAAWPRAWRRSCPPIRRRPRLATGLSSRIAAWARSSARGMRRWPRGSARGCSAPARRWCAAISIGSC